MKLSPMKGKQEGIEETVHAITIKIVQKFPDWSDAEFSGVTNKFVQEIRRELAIKE